MPSFFDKPFEEQVEEIIRTGDLKLLQAFIGIRNPIGLLQYYASFIITKINIMNARLYGRYKLQERCLRWYRDEIAKEDVRKSVADSKALCIPNDENSSLCSRLVSDCSGDIKKELLVNIFLSITNKRDKKYDSISNSDYMCSSDSNQSLISYTRNTEIGRLCSIDAKQIVEMYKIHVNESEEVIKEILKRSSLGSLKQRKEINQELNTIRERIVKQEGEITKYKNSLRKIKDRSFLKEWYWELVDKVKGEVKRKNDHILHKDFSENQREEVFTIRLQNQFILEVVSRILKEIVGDRCSKEQLDYLKDIMMDQLIDNSKLNYQSLVEGVKCALKEKVNEHNGQSREIFELVINEIKPDKFMKAEQSVLDDMLLEAVTQGKQDSALLLICNGANINLEKEKENKTKIKVRKRLDEEILKKPGFLVIRKLYGEMPSIKASLCLNLDIQTFSEFVVEGFSQSVKENYQEFKVEDIFTLAEIREIFPDNTVVKEAADSLAECDKDKLIIKEQVMQKEKVLCELQKKFNSKKEEYTRPSWKWAALAPIVVIPQYSLAYAALYVGACLAYTAVDIGRPWNARRNAKNELEIAQEDLNRAIEMFEVFLEYLQCSVVAGSDIFNKRCEEIKVEIANIKKSKEKWVNLSSVLSAFENVQKVSDVSGKSEFCFNTESIKFNELAGNIISNRMRYMDKLSQPDQPFKSTGQTIVAEDNVKQREERGKRKKAEVEAREERKAKEEAQAKLEEGRRAKEEVEAKLEEERKAKEEERKAKEKAQTRNEAYGSLLLQIRNGELPLSVLQEMDIESLVAGPSWRK